MTQPSSVSNPRLLQRLFVISLLAFLGSCATQPMPASANPPGFFSGYLHGFLILFSLIGSLFTEYRVYAFPNSGWWYDLGFFLGAAVFLGGATAGAK